MKQTSCILQPVTKDSWSETEIPMKAGQPATRNPQPATRNPSPGFTLLEILIAIFIFAIIITTIFASYRIVFSNTDTINKDITSYEMARNCLNRMIMDLQSVHVSLPPDLNI